MFQSGRPATQLDTTVEREKKKERETMFIHSTSFGSLPWPLPRYLSCESESQSECNEVWPFRDFVHGKVTVGNVCDLFVPPFRFWNQVEWKKKNRGKKNNNDVLCETLSSLSDFRRTRHFQGLKRRESEANLDLLLSSGRLFQLLMGAGRVWPLPTPVTPPTPLPTCVPFVWEWRPVVKKQKKKKKQKN